MLRALIAALLAATALGTMAEETIDATVEVDLQQGQIQGVKKTIGDSRSYYSFKGIPYAEPPVGDLRLRDPVPGKPWTTLRKGMEPPVCPQLNSTAFYLNITQVIGEEDCLYLNIYTPAPVASSGLPVMVYIHDGGFSTGSADQNGGTPERLLTKDVVLVSIQYRLGLLGFLSTGDLVLPGNLGLKDQTLALRWVNDNIHEFGGDPKRVTLFGQHVGAVSAQLHTLTPYSRGLFSRVIMQSGSALLKYVISSHHAELAAKIGRDLNCPDYDYETPDSEQLFSCLKKASVESLVLAPRKHSILPMLTPMLMVPIVDGDYLPSHPIQLLREGRNQKVDVISGICQNEGGAPYFMFRGMKGNKTFSPEELDSFGQALTGMYSEDNVHYLNRRVFYHYMDNLEVFTDKNADNLEQMLGEIITHWQDEAAVLHEPDSQYGKNIYRYELQHLGERSLKNYFNAPYAKDWVVFAENLNYLFDNVYGLPPVSRPDDVLLSDIFLSLWTNFAATGNPTPDLELGFKWRPMTSESDFSFLSLTPTPEMKEDHREKNREFWRNLPLKYNKMLYPERFQTTASETCNN